MQRSQAETWNTIKERGGMLPLMLVLFFYRLGGRWLCRVVLYFVILWYWVFSTTARQASLLYLHKLHHFSGVHSPFAALPQLPHTFTHLMQFGECILDKIEGWLGRVSDQNLQLHGHEHFREHYQKGAIIVVSHFGNIELLRAIKSEHPQKINVLVYQKHATQFNQFLKKLNQHADVNLLSVDELGIETALILQQKLDQGEWIVVAADRVPIQSDRIQPIEFLGEHADWPEGAWILAHLLKAPVLAVFCYRVKDHFEVHIHNIAVQLNFPRKDRATAIRQVMRIYIHLLEQHCLRAPYQWFNFYNFWNKR